MIILKIIDCNGNPFYLDADKLICLDTVNTGNPSWPFQIQITATHLTAVFPVQYTTAALANTALATIVADILAATSLCDLTSF